MYRLCGDFKPEKEWSAAAPMLMLRWEQLGAKHKNVNENQPKSMILKYLHHIHRHLGMGFVLYDGSTYQGVSSSLLEPFRMLFISVAGTWVPEQAIFRRGPNNVLASASFSKIKKNVFFGYFDPENIFLDNENN